MTVLQAGVGPILTSQQKKEILKEGCFYKKNKPTNIQAAQ